jgi:MSHA biogenesis protein MshK
MDEAVNLTKAAALALLFVLQFAVPCAQAETLQDPTRPPAAAVALSATPAAASAGPRLQSILVAREAGGRHLAVIDGETVRLGEQFHGARVARIGDNEVELVRGAERQVLRLYAEEAGSVTPARASAQKQARR